MINLHERYGHYLTTGRKHDRIDERVIAYGWTDNGKDLTGYYVLTENHRLLYSIKGEYQGMEPLVCSI